jgi:tRNA(Arg) A34 adenosine deaminase TadA
MSNVVEPVNVGCSDSGSEGFIREAIELAESAKLNGNHPFGALLVVEGKVVLRAENTVVTKRNFTHHAETNLMNQVAASDLSPADIAKAVLYTSTEPCAMCSGAIFWGGVKKVVYGCPCEVLGNIAGDDFLIPCRTLFATSKEAPVTVEGPVLLEESTKPHLGFWGSLH